MQKRSELQSSSYFFFTLAFISFPAHSQDSNSTFSWPDEAPSDWTFNYLLQNRAIALALEQIVAEDAVSLVRFDREQCINDYYLNNPGTNRNNAGMSGRPDFSRESCSGSLRKFNERFSCIDPFRTTQGQILFQQETALIQKLVGYSSTLNVSTAESLPFLNFKIGAPTDLLTFMFLQTLSTELENTRATFDQNFRLQAPASPDLRLALDRLSTEVGAGPMIFVLFGREVCGTEPPNPDPPILRDEDVVDMVKDRMFEALPEGTDIGTYRIKHANTGISFLSIEDDYEFIVRIITARARFCSDFDFRSNAKICDIYVTTRNSFSGLPEGSNKSNIQILEKYLSAHERREYVLVTRVLFRYSEGRWEIDEEVKCEPIYCVPR